MQTLLIYIYSLYAIAIIISRFVEPVMYQLYTHSHTQTHFYSRELFCSNIIARKDYILSSKPTKHPISYPPPNILQIHHQSFVQVRWLYNEILCVALNILANFSLYDIQYKQPTYTHHTNLLNTSTTLQTSTHPR